MLSILILLLLFSIAFIQSTQGFFSALIMSVLTICCAGLAFGTAEWIADQWIAPNWHSDYAYSVALASSFGLPLIIFRLAADNLIRRSCLLPAWIDRVGAGFCGVVTSFVLVGVTAVCLQAIPFDGAFLGYARIPQPIKVQLGDASAPVPPDPNVAENELIFKPDHFAARVGAILSDGLFSGPARLLDVHPEPVREIGWINAVPAKISRYAPANSIDFVASKLIDTVYKRVPGDKKTNTPETFEPLPPKSGHQFQMVRLKLLQSSKGGQNFHRFTLRQFRLLGQSNGSETTNQFTPVAIRDDDQNLVEQRFVRIKQDRWGDWPVTEDPAAPLEGNLVEIVFELPKGFEPWFLEYKGGARVVVTFSDGDEENDTQTAAPSASPEPTTVTDPPRRAPVATTVSSSSSPQQKATTTRKSGSRRRGGRVRRNATRKGKSFFGDNLPVQMTAFRQLKNADIGRGALTDGHLVGFVDEQDGGQGTPVTQFNVPTDKRLLQLQTDFLNPRSGLGRAISSAVKVAQNYTVEDAKGKRYSIIGKYAIATVNGRDVVEVQYFSTLIGSIGGLGNFDRIKDSHLKGTYTLAYLFLVDPGVQIVRFATGGSASRDENLLSDNLVAPK